MFPSIRGLLVQLPVERGDVVGIECTAGGDRPATVTVAAWIPAGPYRVANSSVSARTPALPRDRLVTSGTGTGIPPVIRYVPRPDAAIRGSRWAAAVMAPTTLTAHTRWCSAVLSSPGASDRITAAL